jgi:hypothetical protein
MLGAMSRTNTSEKEKEKEKERDCGTPMIRVVETKKRKSLRRSPLSIRNFRARNRAKYRVKKKSGGNFALRSVSSALLLCPRLDSLPDCVTQAGNQHAFSSATT